MSFHFSRYLEKNNIETVASRLGFANSIYLEKFILDFEMYYHISKKLDCIVRGGMCMPFHTNEDLRRLSIDIDIITSKTVNETIAIMKELEVVDNLSIKIKTPETSYPIPNLLSYDVEYKSCFGNDDRIKVDFICGVNIELPTIIQNSGFRIFDCELDFPVKILKHGALMGDKLSTLAINKIGLPPRKYNDIPKQIYDIATLIRLTDVEKLKECFEVFNRFTSYKVQIYQKNPPYTVAEIIDTINESLESFLSFNHAFSITSEHDTRYGNFKGRYLSDTRQQYKKTEHITDVLLVWLLSKYLSNYLSGSITIDTACSAMHNSINELEKIQQYDVEKRNRERTSILDNFPQISFNKKILRGLSLEHVYLIKEILSRN